MTRLRASLRELLDDESGWTLVEIFIATAISAVLFAVFASILVSVQGTINDEQDRSNTNDQVRLAIDAFDRHLRSANFLWKVNDYSLLAYTQSNAPAQGQRCMQWRLNDRRLERRTWPPNAPGSATGWSVLATDVVNQELAEPVFDLLHPVTTGGRTVNIALLVNSDYPDDPDATTGVEVAITARNVTAPAGTPSATPPHPCDTIP